MKRALSGRSRSPSNVTASLSLSSNARCGTATCPKNVATPPDEKRTKWTGARGKAALERASRSARLRPSSSPELRHALTGLNPQRMVTRGVTGIRVDPNVEKSVQLPICERFMLGIAPRQIVPIKIHSRSFVRIYRRRASEAQPVTIH